MVTELAHNLARLQTFGTILLFLQIVIAIFKK